MATYDLSVFKKGESTKRDGKKPVLASSQATELGKRKITVPKKKGSGTRQITIDQWQKEQLQKYLPKESTRDPAVIARYQKLYDQALKSKNPKLIELRRQALKRIKSGRPLKKGEPEVFTGSSIEDVRSRLEKKLAKLKKKRGYRAGNKEVMDLRKSLRGLDKRYKSAVESGLDAATEAEIMGDEKSPWEELWGYSDAAHRKHLLGDPFVTKPRPERKVDQAKVKKAPPQSGTVIGSYPAATSIVGRTISRPEPKVVKRKVDRKKPVVVPSSQAVSREEGAGARYIREQKEAKAEAKARKAGEEGHFKRLLKERDAARVSTSAPARVSAPAIDTPMSKDDSLSGLEQFWKDVKDLPKYLGTDLLPESHREDVVKGFKKFGKDITDLPSNLAKDFLPEQIKGSKKEGYMQDLEDMGPGKRKYKWGDLEFTLDTTEKEMTKGRPKESYKKGGRIKKSVKKTKARKPPAKTKSRKRAALRGHRAELRGG